MSSWAELQVGDRIQTPFGAAEVLAIDSMRLMVQTDLGLWDLSEVEPREVPEHMTPDSLVEYLTGPAFEVHTSHDFITRSCGCTCKSCSADVMSHKLTKREVRRDHLPGFSCNCIATACWCLAQSLEDLA